MIQYWLPGWSLKDMVDEVGRTAQAELNYLSEAASRRELRQPMGDLGIKIPQVIQEYSRSNVLVTEWVEGSSLNATSIEQLTDNQRLNIAQRIYDAFLCQVLDLPLFSC